MLGGHLGVANAQALAASVLDELAGEVTFGALEGGAGRGHLPGLFLGAATGEIVHACANDGGGVGPQLKRGAQHHPALVHHAARAIAPCRFARGDIYDHQAFPLFFPFGRAADPRAFGGGFALLGTLG